jgi:type II secretory pathway component PulM
VVRIEGVFLDISKRDKKVLMIGGLAVVLFLIINYVISPFIESENVLSLKVKMIYKKEQSKRKCSLKNMKG